MIRYFFSFLFFLIIVEIETVFVHLLPYPFLFLPLVFSTSLYLYQHWGSWLGIWWLFGLGLFLDFWHIGLTPGESFFYALTAFLVVFLGQRFFSNRSFYGVNLCALLALLILHFFHGLYFFIISFNEASVFPWINFFKFIIWQSLFSVLIVSSLFFFANRLRLFFRFLLTTDRGL